MKDFEVFGISEEDAKSELDYLDLVWSIATDVKDAAKLLHLKGMGLAGYRGYIFRRAIEQNER